MLLDEFYDVWITTLRTNFATRREESFLSTAKTFEGVKNIMSMLGAYRVGQIHKLFEKEGDPREIRTMVKLLNWIAAPSDCLGGPPGDWEVEDLRTGHKELVGEEYLSWYSFNEMEVLAWAAK